MNFMKLILVIAIMQYTLALNVKHSSKSSKYGRILKNDLKLLDAEQLQDLAMTVSKYIYYHYHYYYYYYYY